MWKWENSYPRVGEDEIRVFFSLEVVTLYGIIKIFEIEFLSIEGLTQFSKKICPIETTDIFGSNEFITKSSIPKKNLNCDGQETNCMLFFSHRGTLFETFTSLTVKYTESCAHAFKISKFRPWNQ